MNTKKIALILIVAIVNYSFCGTLILNAKEPNYDTKKFTEIKHVFIEDLKKTSDDAKKPFYKRHAYKIIGGIIAISIIAWKIYSGSGGNDSGPVDSGLSTGTNIAAVGAAGIAGIGIGIIGKSLYDEIYAKGGLTNAEIENVDKAINDEAIHVMNNSKDDKEIYEKMMNIACNVIIDEKDESEAKK